MAWFGVIALLIVMGGWIPGGFGGDRVRSPWSRCGSDLCVCTPIPIEPACPLCESGETSGGGSACLDGDASGAADWTRRVERLDRRVPMAIELIGVSLVLRLGGEAVSVPSPSWTGLAALSGSEAGDAGPLPVAPPPPRSALRA
jgi:hypothetical protein